MGDVEDKEVKPTGDVFRRSTLVYSTRGKRTQCGHIHQQQYLLPAVVCSQSQNKICHYVYDVAN